MIESLQERAELTAPTIPRQRLLGEVAIEAPEVEAPANDFVDVELEVNGETEQARAWYTVANGDPNATYMDALRYGKEHNCTVIWGVAKPAAITGEAEAAGRKVAVIFEHNALLGDKLRYEAQKAGAPRTPTMANTATQAVASRLGDELKFDPREIYGQDSWEHVRL